MESFEKLIEVPVAQRGEAWEKSFLTALPDAAIRVLRPEPQEGPDHWPYMMVGTGEGADDAARNVLGWLSTRGIGMVINPHKPAPDYVLTYGMIWNYRERGEFLTAVPSTSTSPSAGRFEFKDGQEVMTGVPSESYLPKYVRSVIKQFLADQGVFAPKVLMISTDKVNYDLCFSIESLKSPPVHEHSNIAEALSWFLPAHYSVALVSDKVIAGFQPL